jgi:peroxiredoxin
MKKIIFVIALILNFTVLAEINKKTVTLDKFKGSVVVMYFFGDDMDKWNKPISELNELQKKFKDKNVKIGAITPKSLDNIKSFTKSIDFLTFAKSIDFTVVAESDTAKKYKIKPPYVYVITPD